VPQHNTLLTKYDDNTGTFVSMKMTSSTVRYARPAGLLTFRDLSPKIIHWSHDLHSQIRGPIVIRNRAGL